MTCYNRQSYVTSAVESILKQSFVDFEFIIIDDCSTDNSLEILTEYAKLDTRIRLFRNEANLGLIASLNKGLSIARGKYIARMDDDDISLPERFAQQVEFMEQNQHIAVLGTYLGSFNEEGEKLKSWVDADNAEIIGILLNFKCPISHPCVFIRSAFLQEYNLSYDEQYKHAEDYGLWCEILLKGGKIANLPQVLFKHRASSTSIMRNANTQKISNESAAKIRTKLLSRFFSKSEIEAINARIKNHSFLTNKAKDLCEIIQIMRQRDTKQIYTNESYEAFLAHFCGTKDTLHIFFTINNKYLQHLCVTLSSILVNASFLDEFSFYILSDELSEEEKEKIYSLKSIKDFDIEFIEINRDYFCDTPISEGKNTHLSREVYYRYLIPELKPNIKQSIYLDCDIVVEDSLNLLYHTDLKDCYVAAVEDMWINAQTRAKKLYDIDSYFNAGVLVINHKLWLQDKITEKLFFYTHILELEGKLLYNDQDVLNFVCKNKCLFLSPIYNAQDPISENTKRLSFLKYQEDVTHAKNNPVIIHFTGPKKPWKPGYTHIFGKKYKDYLCHTPFYEQWLKKNLQFVDSNGYLLPLHSSAVTRIKNMLSYKIGYAIVTAKSPAKIIKLPFALIQIIYTHKMEQDVLKAMHLCNPEFKLPPLEACGDYEEGLRVKRHLSYRLGNALIKHPFTFYFYLKKDTSK